MVQYSPVSMWAVCVPFDSNDDDADAGADAEQLYTDIACCILSYTAADVTYSYAALESCV